MLPGANLTVTRLSPYVLLRKRKNTLETHWVLLSSLWAWLSVTHTVQAAEEVWKWLLGTAVFYLLSELRADVQLVLAVSVVLQLRLVGLFCLLQCDQGSGQKLFIVPLPLLGRYVQLCQGETPPVPHTFMLHLKEQNAQGGDYLHIGWHKCINWYTVHSVMLNWRHANKNPQRHLHDALHCL